MRTSGRGTSAQMEQAFMNQINKLSGTDGDVESCDAINSAVDDNSSQYLNRLIELTEAHLKDEYPMATVTSEVKGNTIVIIVNQFGVHEYTVPFDDLSFSIDEIDDDAFYIVDCILDSLN